MKPLSRSPAYIIWNSYSYCFRVSVPKDLQRFVGKRELRYSLRTGYLGVAKSKARFLAVSIQLLFRTLRKGGSVLTDLDDSKIRDLVNEYLEQYKKGVEERYLGPPDSPPFFPDVRALNDHLKELVFIIEDRKLGLAMGTYTTVEKDAESILDKSGILGVEKNSQSYIRLCRAIQRADIKAMEYERKFLLNELPEETPPVPPPMQPPPPETPSITLKKLIEIFWEDSLRSNRWSDSTIKEYKNGYNVIAGFFGAETPVNKIGYKELQDFKEMLKKLPSNFTRSKQYEGMTFRDVLKFEEIGTLSISAMNRYIMNAQALFNHGVRNNHMTINPAAGIQFQKERRKPSEEKSEFNHQDLTKIFRSQKYLEDDFVQPYMFWLPILGLYTGCRIEEICQLFCSDIALYDGVWCFDINDEPGKKLKNVSSKRVIPLHPVLIDPLNFPGYAQKQAEGGHERIFNELKKIGKGYAHSAGKWFNERYKHSVGIIVQDGEKKSFHSFRHTFTNNLKQKMLQQSVVDEITGRTVQGESFGRYGKAYAAKNLLEHAILKLDYGLDLSHLKNNRKWVVR
jgi:integrase